MLAFGVILLIGFALGYGVREAISRRRREAERRRHLTYWISRLLHDLYRQARYCYRSSARTEMTARSVMCSLRAAASERSRILLRLNGPRSVIVTTTL